MSGENPVTTGETQPEAAEAAAPEEKTSEIHVRLFGRTDVGQIREHNEDNFIVADLSRRSRGLMESERDQVVGDRGTMLGVCDGMGGAAAGEVAAQMAVDTLYELMLEGDPPDHRDTIARRLVEAIEEAGLRINREAKANRTRRGMGTTSTVAAMVDDHLFLGQVGDSRAYILRKGELVQVTRDQSLVNQLIEAGQLTEEEAENFEHNNIILQALGTSETVQVDLTFVELRHDDVLMLCSDGLSGMVRKQELRDILLQCPDPLEACKELTDRANKAGGHDNITCIVAHFTGGGLKEISDDDAELKYRKYALPDHGGTADFDDPTVRQLDPGFRQPEPEHKPPNSKLMDTIVSEFSADDIRKGIEEASRKKPSGGSAGEEPVELPYTPTPGWVIALLVVATAALVAFVGFQLLHLVGAS